MTVEFWDMERITPYESIPSCCDNFVDELAKSIAEYGITQPILVDANGVIVYGHLKWAAAKKLGLSEVPVHIANHLTADRIKAFRIYDIHRKRSPSRNS